MAIFSFNKDWCICSNEREHGIRREETADVTWNSLFHLQAYTGQTGRRIFKFIRSHLALLGVFFEAAHLGPSFDAQELLTSLCCSRSKSAWSFSFFICSSSSRTLWEKNGKKPQVEAMAKYCLINHSLARVESLKKIINNPVGECRVIFLQFSGSLMK